MLCDVLDHHTHEEVPHSPRAILKKQVKRLEAMGRWLDGNGEAIFGTQASPLPAPAWGRITLRRDGGDSRLYLHVFDWPAGGRLP